MARVLARKSKLEVSKNTGRISMLGAWLALTPAAFSPRGLPTRRAPAAARSAARLQAAATTDEEVDVVVIGAGLGGLSCAGLLASQGLKVAGVACGCYATAAWSTSGVLLTWGRGGGTASRSC